MKSDLIYVLDIGSTKAVCMAATAGEDGLVEIRGLGSIECKGLTKGVVTNLEGTCEAIDKSVRDVQRQVGHEVHDLVVGITGNHIEGLTAQGFVPIFPRTRHITREDVLQVINHSRQMMIPPDREQIQAIPREFRIDGQRGVQRPIGMSGGKLEVVTYIVTGQTTHIHNIEKAISMSGKNIEQIVLQSLASGMAVLTDDELELGCAVVDIGGGTSDLAIFSNGSIAYGASLPIGGQLVTSDLSKLLKTSPEEAERLKTFFGYAKASLVPEKESVEVMQLGETQARPLQRKVLSEIIESRMRELAVMVKQQIEKSGMYGVLPGGLILTGGGSQLPGTDKLFEDVLKHMKVRIGKPRIGGSMDSGEIGPEYATAVGMARFALQCGEEELVPANGIANWKDKIKVLRSLLGGRG